MTPRLTSRPSRTSSTPHPTPTQRAQFARGVVGSAAVVAAFVLFGAVVAYTSGSRGHAGAIRGRSASRGHPTRHRTGQQRAGAGAQQPGPGRDERHGDRGLLPAARADEPVTPEPGCHGHRAHQCGMGSDLREWFDRDGNHHRDVGDHVQRQHHAGVDRHQSVHAGESSGQLAHSGRPAAIRRGPVTATSARRGRAAAADTASIGTDRARYVAQLVWLRGNG